VFDFYVKSHVGMYHVLSVNDIPSVYIEDNVFVVIDRKVNDLYYNFETDNPHCLAIDANEEVKTLDGVCKVIEFLTSNGFKKNSTLWAIGGGVIQDVVSFAASILYRGVSWFFVPTTLLSQCDSCIGSKTSINHNGAKNILGGFHPPSNIFICRKFLNTLPREEILSGVGEMLHYFLLNDDLELAMEMATDDDLLDNLDKYIDKSLSIKCKMIERDEFDKGPRNVFNYGHTFGHAIEIVSNYAINHGQAVTLGMMIANFISLSRGVINKEKYYRLQTILSTIMVDFKIDDMDAYMAVLAKDKKNVGSDLTCILIHDGMFGCKTNVSYEEVRKAVQEILGR